MRALSGSDEEILVAGYWMLDAGTAYISKTLSLLNTQYLVSSIQILVSSIASQSKQPLIQQLQCLFFVLPVNQQCNIMLAAAITYHTHGNGFNGIK